MKHYQVLIIGRGLSALTTALRLTELGITDILLTGAGCGGTPAIAAINFVLPDNPSNDTPDSYAEDMMRTGYGISNSELVKDMARHSQEGYEFLCRAGVAFATLPDGSLKRRRLSGHSHARSLCQDTGLLGAQLVNCLTQRLRERGVTFLDKECVSLLSDGRRVYGATLLDRKHFNKLDNVYASVVVAAWGGVGQLFPRTTYPADVNGRTLAMAYRAGAALCDLEFLEYEPMVTLWPEGAMGEPCPTAMLGEGAYLLNDEGRRFVLDARPEGEAGAPKSLLNELILEQVAQGHGSPHGGCYADLRHIPADVLDGYPWFMNRLRLSGLDPARELVEVAPMAHSFSGGIEVDRAYRSRLSCFYAVGEAAGGIHGACRCAGNAASQAVISGLLCAQDIASSGATQVLLQKRFPCQRRIEQSVFLRYAPQMQQIAADALSLRRSGVALKKALQTLSELENQRPVRQDDDTRDLALALRLMLTAALDRQESRGVHQRTDMPDTLAEEAHSRAYRREEL